jgi:hypothetical protein
VDLNNYKTDIVAYGGINLWESARGNKFDVDLSVGLMKAMLILILVIF